MATHGGFYAQRGDKDKTKTYGNGNNIGPATVKPISIELGGRPGPRTRTVLQGLTTKLADACGGELNAATALRKLCLTLERTLIRSEADALNATLANEEQVRLRCTLKETERVDECEGSW